MTVHTLHTETSLRNCSAHTTYSQGANTMEICIAYMRGKPIMLSLKEGIVYIGEEAQPIKNVTENELKEFAAAVASIPYSTDPGYQALVNARRAAFIATLLGRAVGEECVSKLGHILDSVHYDVLEYLGENDNA